MSTPTAEVSGWTGKNTELPSTQPGSSQWMAGFFLLGILLGMPGSLVITWHYHIDVEPQSIGLHFLGMSAGFVIGSQILPRLLSGVRIRTVGICSTALAFLSLVGLALLAPPAAADWRIAALATAGVAAGGLTYSLFYANQMRFETLPATSANRAGALFVGGSLLATVVVGVTYYWGSIEIQTALLSVVPAVYFVILLTNRFPPALALPNRHREDLFSGTLKDLRSIATVLFSLLIFFQFACEWAIAGWLPLFLVHTLGLNPVTAIWALGLYFLALMVGRLVAQILMPLLSHRKMLLASVAAAMAGYIVLSLTWSTGLALAAAVVVGLGHASIYPLIAERLDDRFPYHPGFFSGTISFAMAGATATPWLLGYTAGSLGTRAVMLIPSIASIVVLILAVLIMLESRLMGRKQHDTGDGLLASE
jgi:FHS family glucose/mannose:H+ symporter-like MFS transporter